MLYIPHNHLSQLLINTRHATGRPDVYSNTILMMGRTIAVAVVTALSLLTSMSAAARPLKSETSAFALAPSASEGAQWRDDMAARAGKYMWLPFGGGGISGVHFPVYPVARPMLWAAGAAPALGLGSFRTGGQLVQMPHVDVSHVTRQEQAAMWASLLKPSKRPTSTSWLPVPDNGEAADAEPKTSVADEGTEAVDVPAGDGVQMGQPKLGA